MLTFRYIWWNLLVVRKKSLKLCINAYHKNGKNYQKCLSFCISRQKYWFLKYDVNFVQVGLRFVPEKEKRWLFNCARRGKILVRKVENNWSGGGLFRVCASKLNKGVTLRVSLVCIFSLEFMYILVD